MPRTQHPAPLRSEPPAQPDVMSAYPRGTAPWPLLRAWPDVMSAHPRGTAPQPLAPAWPDVMSRYPRGTAP